MSIQNETLDDRDSSFYVGIALIVAGTVLFSTKPILIKLIYQYEASPAGILGWRMIFSLPVYLFVGWIAWKQKRGTISMSWTIIIQSAIIGMIGYYVSAYLNLVGLQYVTAQLERLIVYTFPLITAILGFFLFGERITRSMMLAFALSYTGLLLIFGHDLQTLGKDVVKGSLIELVCAFTFSIYFVLTKPMISKIGSRLFTSIAMGAASLGIFAHLIVTGDVAALNMPIEAITIAAVVAIFGTVMPSYMINEAIGRLGPSRTSVINSFGPAVTSLLAVLILGEAFTVYHLGGLALVIGGMSILTRKGKPRPVSKTEP